MKIGVNLYSIRNMITNKNDLTKTLKLLKKYGCDFVQFSGSPVALTDLAKISKATKMPVVITHSPFDRIVNDTTKLIKEHKAMHCQYIGLGSFDKKLYLNEKKLKATINQLEIVAKQIEKQKMHFFFHNHQTEFMKFANGETVLDYMIRKAPHIHFTLDVYWVQYGGASVLETINKLKGRIECVHLKDYKINNEFLPEFAPLGDGNVNFPCLVKAMKKAGTKYFLIEQDNAATKKDGFKDVIKSIKYAKEVL